MKPPIIFIGKSGPMALHKAFGLLHCATGPAEKYVWPPAREFGPGVREEYRYYLHGVRIGKERFDQITFDKPDPLTLALRLIEELPVYWGPDWAKIAELLKENGTLFHMKKLIRKHKLDPEPLDTLMLFLRHRK